VYDPAEAAFLGRVVFWTVVWAVYLLCSERAKAAALGHLPQQVRSQLGVAEDPQPTAFKRLQRGIARWLFATSVKIIRGQESSDLSRAKDDERQEV
jgi:hypothetical protein